MSALQKSIDALRGFGYTVEKLKGEIPGLFEVKGDAGWVGRLTHDEIDDLLRRLRKGEPPYSMLT